MADRSIVLKFGSSVLRTRADLLSAVHEIYRWHCDGWSVVAVVSAIGRTTETLLSEAREFAAVSQPEATAELLATGERHSAALLGIALDRAGIIASVIDPREIGLVATGSPLDSEPVAVDRERALALLHACGILVVPGFFAYSEAGKLCLLGRGGSDLSAVYLACALNARCRLIKDVDGVYESDPAQSTVTSLRRFESLDYAAALLRARQLIQAKAVHFIEQRSACVEVASVGSGYESTIGPLPCRLVPANSRRPLSVLILGLGTVGLGVYQRVTAAPDYFSVVGVLVRDRAKHSADGVPPHLLHDSMDAVSGLRPDVVVDALPGLQPSLALARYYLADGIAVVTANKALIAEAGPDLAAIALQAGTGIRCSAAAGGSAPLIEALQREAARDGIQSIAGVLNGTCNFVLDRCMEQLEFDAAVRAAQASGFAESDPGEDLSGRDAARKLRILARIAFGADIDSLQIEPLDTTTLRSARNGLRDGETLRLIARAWREGGAISGQVRLEPVGGKAGFATTHDEWNRLEAVTASGESIAISGRGAGRWPTAEAVMADLFEVARG